MASDSNCLSLPLSAHRCLVRPDQELKERQRIRGVAVNSERRVRTRGSASSRVWQRFEPGAITKLRSRHTDSRGRYGVEKPTSGIVIRAGSHP